MRSGLKSVLNAENDLFVKGEAKDGEEVFKFLKQNEYDIVTLDIEMPKMSGLEIARKIVEEKVPVKIIFLTMYKDEDIFNEALDIGAMGYVLKENAVNDIVDCVRKASEGQYYISPIISQYLIKREQNLRNFVLSTPSLNHLTKTERLILRLIADDKTSKQIADELFVSYKTIENHRSNISKKLNLHGSHSLIKFALNNKALLL
jgi:DNA-binding NarL/FixJ family response regulator